MSSFFDTLDDFFIGHAHSALGICWQVLIVAYCFFALAIVCDEYLAPALETLCIRWRVREDVAGATFLAFGSAAPEIVINVVTTIKSQVTASSTSSLGISAIIGSGMLAFSFIPAMCCFASEVELQLKRRPLLRDEACYLLALFTLCVAFHDGKIVTVEAVLLLLVWCLHLSIVVLSPWIRKTYRHKIRRIPLKPAAASQSFVHKAKAQLDRQRLLKKTKSQNDMDPLTAAAATTPEYKSTSIGAKLPELRRAVTANALLNENGTVPLSKVQQVYTRVTRPLALLHHPALQLQFEQQDNGDGYVDVPEVESAAIAVNDESHETAASFFRQMSYASASMTSMMSDKSDLHYYGDAQQHREAHLHAPVQLNVVPGQNRVWFYVRRALYVFTMPLRFLFRWTCPAAGEGQPCERLYALTFVMSVLHVAVFSFLLSTIVGAWVQAWSMPQALFGMLLIAIGAEIPDTIESVTMARKAYGSMAVANCQGSQVINIGIGLGLPWLLTNLAGHHVRVCGHQILQMSAVFQCCIVCANFVLLVGIALLRKRNKAVLAKWKAVLLLVLYFTALLAFTLYLYFNHELFKNTC